MTILTNAQFADAWARLSPTLRDPRSPRRKLKTQLTALVDQWNDGAASRASVAARVSEYFDNDRIWKAEYRNWLAGNLTGGFTDDTGATAGGPYYPLTNDLGVTVYVQSPMAMLGRSVGRCGDVRGRFGQRRRRQYDEGYRARGMTPWRLGMQRSAEDRR